MIFYSLVIVSVQTFTIFSDMFDLERCAIADIILKWLRSSVIVLYDYMTELSFLLSYPLDFLLVFHSNCISILYRFIRPPGLDLRSRPKALCFTFGRYFIFYLCQNCPLNVIFGTRNFDITFRLKINKNDPIFGSPKSSLKLMTSSKVQKFVTHWKTFLLNWHFRTTGT